jgi:L-ribulose-5-phosphate 3-epimerase UlaE
MERIEPNSESSWNKFLSTLKEKYLEDDFNTLFPAINKLKVEIVSKLDSKSLVIATFHIKKYLVNKENEGIIRDLQLGELISDFLQIIAKFEGKVLYCKTFLTSSCSSDTFYHRLEFSLKFALFFPIFSNLCKYPVFGPLI